MDSRQSTGTNRQHTHGQEVTNTNRPEQSQTTDTERYPVIKAAHSHRHKVTSTEGQHTHKEAPVHPDDRCRGITHSLHPANSSRQRQQTHTERPQLLIQMEYQRNRPRQETEMHRVQM